VVVIRQHYMPVVLFCFVFFFFFFFKLIYYVELWERCGIEYSVVYLIIDLIVISFVQLLS
jgi:hypothetical protein